MIGPGYWSTGIIVRFWPRGTVSLLLQFFDNGFCDLDSSQGTLTLRYQVQDLARGLDVLIADAERLGIVWNGKPTLYVKGDWEDEGEFYPDNGRALLEAQADRLGWGRP